VVTFSRPRKWQFLLVELCDLSGNHHIAKSPFIIKSQNVWSVCKKISPSFHKLHMTVNAMGVKTIFFIYSKCLKNIGYTKAVVPNPCVTADLPMLENFTAAREYFRNSVFMRRIDKSHAQKVNGISVTTSIHFVISWPGGWGPLPYKACCALLFDAGLDIRTSEKKQCLQRIRTCLEVEWFFLHKEMTTQFPS